MFSKFRFLLQGLHALCVWRPADRGHGGPQGAGVGPAQHGLRAAAQGVQPQVPDALHPRLPQQAGAAPLPSPFPTVPSPTVLLGEVTR